MDKKLALTRAASAFAATLAAAPMAQATENPFSMVEYQGAMRIAADQGEKSCGGGGGEMKCGASMDMGNGGAAKDSASAEAAKAEEAKKTDAQTAAGK